MPRTITTVTNDLIRLMGRPDRFSVEWKVQLSEPDDKWERFITVWISVWSPGDPSVCVCAFAFPKGESEERGCLSRTTLHGSAAPVRLTRKWVDDVLKREIETARIVALSATEADLSKSLREPLTEEAMEEYRQERAYFESSLDT